jgi:hypothetical protein
MSPIMTPMRFMRMHGFLYKLLVAIFEFFSRT